MNDTIRKIRILVPGHDGPLDVTGRIVAQSTGIYHSLSIIATDKGEFYLLLTFDGDDEKTRQETVCFYGLKLLAAFIRRKLPAPGFNRGWYFAGRLDRETMAANAKVQDRCQVLDEVISQLAEIAPGTRFAA